MITIIFEAHGTTLDSEAHFDNLKTAGDLVDRPFMPASTSRG